MLLWAANTARRLLGSTPGYTVDSNLKSLAGRVPHLSAKMRISSRRDDGVLIDVFVRQILGVCDVLSHIVALYKKHF
jgi:hypothetical protein